MLVLKHLPLQPNIINIICSFSVKNLSQYYAGARLTKLCSDTILPTTTNADCVHNFSFTTFYQPETTIVISLPSDSVCVNLCSVMAAIIARITRENRERILKRKHYVPVSKSVYNLRPFPERFNPKLHNKESTFLIIKSYFSLSC